MSAFNQFRQKISQSINQMADNNQSLKVWWRDDDCIEPTEALTQLLKLSSVNNAPISLAVIPDDCKASLQTTIQTQQQVEVLQHGVKHVSQALPGEKKCEFPDHLDRELTLKKIQDGKSLLSSLFKNQFTPIFVPPWNRYSEKHLDLIEKCGFKKMSGYGLSQKSFYFNTHFDLIEWKTSRSFIGETKAIELFQSTIAESNTLGLLSHHLVHDQAIWDFLNFLIPFLMEFENVNFIGAQQASGLSTAQ